MAKGWSLLKPPCVFFISSFLLFLILELSVMKNQTQARPDVPPGEARGGTVLGAGLLPALLPRGAAAFPSQPAPGLTC